MMEDTKGLMQLLNDGFFGNAEYLTKAFVDSNGALDFDRLLIMWKQFDGHKYKLKYLLTYGSVMPSWGVPSKYKDQDEAEQLYKECLEENTTWQDKLNYKVPEDGTMW